MTNHLIPDASERALPHLPRAVGFLHTMDNTEGLKGNTPWKVFATTKPSPFGKPGLDYSASYPVTTEALFTADQMAAYVRADRAAGASAKTHEPERFFMDHGMWHDRETGQHMYTEDEYYEKYRDGLAVGKENAELARAAAQVGANGAILALNDAGVAWPIKLRPDGLWEFVSTPSGALPSIAAGAPAETPKIQTDDEVEKIGQVAALYSRLLDDKQKHDADRGHDRGTAYYIADGIRRAVFDLTIGAGEGKDAQDAKRYRWLRTKSNIHEICFRDFTPGWDGVFKSRAGKELDAAIDAAMRSKTSPGEAG